MGSGDGNEVGIAVGEPEGDVLGAVVGCDDIVGGIDGEWLGAVEGLDVGDELGMRVG